MRSLYTCYQRLWKKDDLEFFVVMVSGIKIIPKKNPQYFIKPWLQDMLV